MKVNTKDSNLSVLAWTTQWDTKCAWIRRTTRTTTRRWSTWWSCVRRRSSSGTRGCIRIRGFTQRAATSHLIRSSRSIRCQLGLPVYSMKMSVRRRILMRAWHHHHSKATVCILSHLWSHRASKSEALILSVSVRPNRSPHSQTISSPPPNT